MKVKIKKLSPVAVIPRYAHPGDAGMDMFAISVVRRYTDKGISYLECGTGISIKIPEGYVGLIFPRSSISNKTLVLSNSVGVIDSGYTGEIKFRFKTIDIEVYEQETSYRVGDKIGQLIIIPYPTIEFEEVGSLKDTVRGSDGFGSTDIN